MFKAFMVFVKLFELGLNGKSKGIVNQPYFNRGRADLPRPRANAYTRKKSMGGNSDNFCIFLNVY